MPNNINTCTHGGGAGGSCVPTPSTGYANVGEWLAGHRIDFEESELDLGDRLCTDWVVSGSPPTREICTDRLSGESDLDFQNRHFEAVAVDMEENPPLA